MLIIIINLNYFTKISIYFYYTLQIAIDRFHVMLDDII